MTKRGILPAILAVLLCWGAVSRQRLGPRLNRPRIPAVMKS